MRKLEGLSASRGIAIGPVFRFVEEELSEIPRYPIVPGEIDAEWQLFETALDVSKNEITLLRDSRNREQSEILDAYLMMLGDPDFIPKIRSDLSIKMVNVEAVLKDAVDEASGILRATGDSYLAERAVDIEDAFGRVMGHIIQSRKAPQSRRDQGSAAARNQASPSRFIPPGTILVATNLKPSEALSIRDSGIAGIVLEEGGATSHVAILARSWRIPAVMGVRGIIDTVTDGEEIILDAENGIVVLDPGTDLASSYRSRLYGGRPQAEDEAGRLSLAKSPAKTKDGVLLTLRANIAMADEAASARKEGATGVGLFRSEFLFLGSDVLPDEETQFAAYRAAVEAMKGDPVVIRTLDAGGDKMLGEQMDLAEKNPLLGWRAVRYCLDRRDLFRTQLRAMLRASHFGDLRIMFPMISSVEELESALEVLDEAKAECAKAGQAFNHRLKIGVMIEIPAAAVCADLLAQKADFMSIGTNDLIQYTMAVDRENSKVAHLYDCYNPAVLRMIRMTIEAGLKERTDVSMCGEMAGDPAAVFLLMGMGLRSFSMAPALIGPVKELVRKVSLADAEVLANAALELSAAREIRKLVQERLKTYE